MKSRLPKLFGENFRRIRKRKRLSQDAVAEKSGTSASYISEIESGNANPTLQTAGRLATGLEVEVAELFIFEQVPASPEQIRQRIKDMIDGTDNASIQSLYDAVRGIFSDK